MVMAMNVVKEGGLSVSAAASRFSVPRKTLDDRVKGRVRHGSKPGVSTVLSSTEEDALESYLIYMADRGFPLTHTMVKAFAWSIAKKFVKARHFNEEYGPGEKWWLLFKRRHPRLSLRRSDPLDRNHAEALNPSIVNEYYDLLHTVLKGKKVKGKGEQKQVQQCPSEISSESDERTTFRNRSSGPSKASSFFGRPRRPPRPRVSSESDGDVIVPGGESGPSEASSSSGRPRRQCQLPS